MDAPHWSRWRFTLATLMLMGGTLELVSIGFLAVAKSNRPESFLVDIDEYMGDEFQADYERFLATSFDSTLGWTLQAEASDSAINCIGEEWHRSVDSRGARVDLVRFGDPFIAAYGDSFTFGDEVNPEQTWSHYLAVRLNRTVDNFGVPAYGTAQAVLRFERNSARGIVAPITILAIFEDNIDRVVNAYRPFYAPLTSLRWGFKPSFRVGPYGVELRPNPNAGAEPSMAGLRRIARAVKMEEFHVPRKVEQHSLHVIPAAKLATIWLDAAYGRFAHDRHYLWHDPEAVAAMQHVVERFTKRATEAGTKPVVVFIPDVRAISKSGTLPHGEFRDRLRESTPELTVIDVLGL
jgi:hypothetical protein